MDYGKYLPNLTPAEDVLYRANLVQRCVERVGDEETRCAEACSCADKDSGKQPNAKCKRSCGGCRSETAQKLNLCKKLGEIPPITAAKAKPSPDASSRPKVGASRPKSTPARRTKDAQPASGSQPLVL